jgi:hypothetical protein
LDQRPPFAVNLDQFVRLGLIEDTPRTEGRIEPRWILKPTYKWSGPIRNLRLVVDKGSPKNLVSSCGKGIRKISATQFEFRASDLSVLFLTPAQAEPGEAQNMLGLV